MGFAAPVDEIATALEDVAGLDALVETGVFDDLGPELVHQVLGEAGRFASEVVAPLNRIGDLNPARLENDRVATPQGFAEAYGQWVEGGWNGLAIRPEFGGQGLPFTLNVAIAEMMNGASIAFSLSILLTQGAAEALAAHGSDDLKTRFLPRLVSGEWTGTMNLTEPQSGSDLATIKTQAVPADDGTYRIFGQKIFITHGEHEWTDNILHLVLARLPDAPPGTGGISMFLVPKRMVGEDGLPGARNDLRCVGLEHKLGIHASPTCVMAYGENDGAVGYLVGDENAGLACMFTMMNMARLLVGVQGVGVAERASQEATAFARERRQGRQVADSISVSVPIIDHPDVRRMLATMRSLTGAARGICLATAVAIDLARHAGDEDERRVHQARADLLTPVAKSFSTDIAVEVASLGIQVHGGMGFVEETGAAQLMRDARILPIYEGTNGIQAIDLAFRKVARDRGASVNALIDELRETADQAMTTNEPLFGRLGYRLSEAVDDLAEASDWIVQASAEPDSVLAVATPYQRLFGLAAGGGFLAKGALAAAKALDQGDRLRSERILLARFFAENLLCETRALRHTVMQGGEALLAYEFPTGTA